MEYPSNYWKDQKGKTLNDHMKASIPGARLPTFDGHGQSLNEKDQCYSDVINQVRM